MTDLLTKILKGESLEIPLMYSHDEAFYSEAIARTFKPHSLPEITFGYQTTWSGEKELKNCVVQIRNSLDKNLRDGEEAELLPIYGIFSKDFIRIDLFDSKPPNDVRTFEIDQVLRDRKIPHRVNGINASAFRVPYSIPEDQRKKIITRYSIDVNDGRQIPFKILQSLSQLSTKEDICRYI